MVIYRIFVIFFFLTAVYASVQGAELQVRQPVQKQMPSGWSIEGLQKDLVCLFMQRDEKRKREAKRAERAKAQKKCCKEQEEHDLWFKDVLAKFNMQQDEKIIVEKAAAQAEDEKIQNELGSLVRNSDSTQVVAESEKEEPEKKFTSSHVHLCENYFLYGNGAGVFGDDESEEIEYKTYPGLQTLLEELSQLQGREADTFLVDLRHEAIRILAGNEAFKKNVISDSSEGTSIDIQFAEFLVLGNSAQRALDARTLLKGQTETAEAQLHGKQWRRTLFLIGIGCCLAAPFLFDLLTRQKVVTRGGVRTASFFARHFFSLSEQARKMLVVGVPAALFFLWYCLQTAVNTVAENVEDVRQKWETADEYWGALLKNYKEKMHKVQTLVGGGIEISIDNLPDLVEKAIEHEAKKNKKEVTHDDPVVMYISFEKKPDEKKMVSEKNDEQNQVTAESPMKFLLEKIREYKGTIKVYDDLQKKAFELVIEQATKDEKFKDACLADQAFGSVVKNSKIAQELLRNSCLDSLVACLSIEEWLNKNITLEDRKKIEGSVEEGEEFYGLKMLCNFMSTPKKFSLFAVVKKRKPNQKIEITDYKLLDEHLYDNKGNKRIQEETAKELALTDKLGTWLLQNEHLVSAQPPSKSKSDAITEEWKWDKDNKKFVAVSPEENKSNSAQSVDSRIKIVNDMKSLPAQVRNKANIAIWLSAPGRPEEVMQQCKLDTKKGEKLRAIVIHKTKKDDKRKQEEVWKLTAIVEVDPNKLTECKRDDDIVRQLEAAGILDELPALEKDYKYDLRDLSEERNTVSRVFNRWIKQGAQREVKKELEDKKRNFCFEKWIWNEVTNTFMLIS